MKHLVFLFVLVSSSAYAGGIYTWVDEYGKTNYGDEPPPSVISKEVKVDPAPSNPGPPPPKLDTATPETGTQQSGATRSETPKPDTEVGPDQAKDLCEMAHRELKYLNKGKRKSRVRTVDGGTANMTTEQRRARRDQANKDVEAYC